MNLRLCSWFHQHKLICNAIPKGERCCCCINLRIGGFIIAIIHILNAVVNFLLVTWFAAVPMDAKVKLNYAFIVFAYIEDALDVWLAVLLTFGILRSSWPALLTYQWVCATQIGLFLISLLLGALIVEPYQLIWGFTYAFVLCKYAVVQFFVCFPTKKFLIRTYRCLIRSVVSNKFTVP